MKLFLELDTEAGDEQLMLSIAAALSGTGATTQVVQNISVAKTETETVAEDKPTATAEPEDEPADTAEFRAYGKPLTTSRRTKGEMAEDKKIEELFEALDGNSNRPSEIPTDIAATDVLAQLKAIKSAPDEEAEEADTSGDDDADTSGDDDADTSGDDDGDDDAIKTTDQLRALVLKANKAVGNTDTVAVLKKYGSGLSKISEDDIPTVAEELKTLIAGADDAE